MISVNVNLLILSDEELGASALKQVIIHYNR